MLCRDLSQAEYLAGWPEWALWVSKNLFHEPTWLQYLVSIGKGTPRFLQIAPAGSPPVAIHVYLDVRVGPLRVMGSPLPGWTTNYMGPLFDAGADQVAVVRAIQRYARRHGYLYAEIKNKSLDPAAMQAAGFDQSSDVTAALELTRDPQEAWRAFNGTARNRIRKAEKLRVVCEPTSDRSFVEEYYEMIVRRYQVQGLSFPFKVDRLLALWDCLMPAGRLKAFRVSHDGATIGGGLFPFDDRAIYYFGGASREEANHLCPNELMHWSVIRFACEQGIREYDLCGTSRFKRKFGTRDVPFITYGYSPVPGLIRVRDSLHHLHWKRLAWKHKISRMVARTPASAKLPASEE